jgi:hypothetical protein
VNKFSSNEDRIASNWLYLFIYNSSTDPLHTAVGKKYDKLPGGVSYLYLTLNEMFQMSGCNVQIFIDIFKQNGVSHSHFRSL